MTILSSTKFKAPVIPEVNSGKLYTAIGKATLTMPMNAGVEKNDIVTPYGADNIALGSPKKIIDPSQEVTWSISVADLEVLASRDQQVAFFFLIERGVKSYKSESLEINLNYANLRQMKVLCIDPRPQWFDSIGFTKGIDHDCQELGFILPANVPLRIRQTNLEFKTNLTIWLLTDDKRTEKKVDFSNGFVEVMTDVESVPFIKTPYGAVDAEIEFEISQSKTLPIYEHKKSNEKEFFDAWNSYDPANLEQLKNTETQVLSVDSKLREGVKSYALFKSKYINIIFPLASKEYLEKELSAKGGLEKLGDWYSDVFESYNRYAGLTPPLYDTDQNIPNHYLGKADKSKKGTNVAGYYSKNYTAEGTEYSHNFFGRPDAASWGGLHEIAHGYQGLFMNNSSMGISEVWNNIYACMFQYENLGERFNKESWLYAGNKRGMHYQAYLYTTQGKEVNSWALNYKLLFFMMIFNKIGFGSFGKFNSEFRRKYNSTAYHVNTFNILDAFSEIAMSENNKLNIVPFILACGGGISSLHREIAKYSFLRGASLAMLMAPSLYLEKGDDFFEIIDDEQVKSLNLPSLPLTLNFNIDNIEDILGQPFYLYQGVKCIYSGPILARSLVIPSLPQGLYTIHAPSGKEKKYNIKNDYLYHTDERTSSDIYFNMIKHSEISNQTLLFLGYSNNLFCSVTIKLSEMKVIVSVLSVSPHYYYGDQLYAYVRIYSNTDNSELFYVEMKGEGNITGEHEFYLDDDELSNLRLEIYHAETVSEKRLASHEGDEFLIDYSENKNIYVITGKGLKNLNLQDSDPYENFIKRLENKAEIIRGSSLNNVQCSTKDDFWLALKALTENQMGFVREYKDLVPLINLKDEISKGNKYKIQFKGYSDTVFLTITVETVLSQENGSDKIRVWTIETHPVKPHYLFNEIYASLVLFSDTTLSSNESLNLSIDIFGGQVLEERKWIYKQPFISNELLFIRHEEYSRRLLFQNESTGGSIKMKGKFQSFTFNSEGVIFKGDEPEIALS